MEWIKVADKLPEEGQIVIYYFSVTGIDIGQYNKDEETGINVFSGCNGWLGDDVTHWMPLPKSPKEI